MYTNAYEKHFSTWTARGDALPQMDAGTAEQGGVRTGYFSETPHSSSNTSLDASGPANYKTLK